jgi:SAM-dependent methyltransferase
MQGRLWGAAARDWAELQEPMSLPLWDAMLRAAGVRTGTRILDAGCGSGGASALAAQHGAQVSGLDASDALIALARKRVPAGAFRVGDLEALPYGEQAFDVVVAANSVQYAADPIAALRELKRVCAPQGMFVIGTWGLPERCEQRVILKAVRDSLPSPPSGEGPFALSAAGALERLVEQAGWRVVGTGEVDCPFEYRDLESHWRAQSAAGPMQAARQTVGEGPLRAVVEQAIAEYRTPTGGVRLENRFRYVTATA